MPCPIPYLPSPKADAFSAAPCPHMASCRFRIYSVRKRMQMEKQSHLPSICPVFAQYIYPTGILSIPILYSHPNHAGPRDNNLSFFFHCILRLSCLQQNSHHRPVARMAQCAGRSYPLLPKKCPLTLRPALADEENTTWNFCPSIAAAYLFAILFGLTTVAHLVQAIIYRKGYSWVIIASGLLQTVCYAFRIVSINNPTSDTPSIIWFVLILVRVPLA